MIPLGSLKISLIFSLFCVNMLYFLRCLLFLKLHVLIIKNKISLLVSKNIYFSLARYTCYYFHNSYK